MQPLLHTCRRPSCSALCAMPHESEAMHPPLLIAPSIFRCAMASGPASTHLHGSTTSIENKQDGEEQGFPTQQVVGPAAPSSQGSHPSRNPGARIFEKLPSETTLLPLLPVWVADNRRCCCCCKYWASKRRSGGGGSGLPGKVSI